MFNTQYFNNYNLIIIFFQDCENYIISIFHIDFRVNKEKIF